MGRLFARAYAPSTLGSFLRKFTFGHVRQLDAIASRFLIALGGLTRLVGACAGAAGPGCPGVPLGVLGRDYDIVYFDHDDLTEATEKTIEAEVAALTGVGGMKIDVTNEARVHIWYEQRFGRSLAPYRSVEHAIATWPTTAASVAVRPAGSTLVVCAPFGLVDLFAMVVRPNTTLVPQAVYEAKVERWRGLWSRLTVMPWP